MFKFSGDFLNIMSFFAFIFQALKSLISMDSDFGEDLNPQ